MPHPKLTVDQINCFTEADFVSTLGGVFEHSPQVARQAWHAHPFGSLGDIHRAMCAVVDGYDLAAKEDLIRAHPDLAGTDAITGALSPESTHEQASAGLSRLTDIEVNHFRDLTGRYRATFGFPFVICARENKMNSILAAMADRLHNNRLQEIDIAVKEIGKIAWLRLLDLIDQAPEES